jgi:hypothetical protein
MKTYAIRLLANSREILSLLDLRGLGIEMNKDYLQAKSSDEYGV